MNNHNESRGGSAGEVAETQKVLNRLSPSMREQVEIVAQGKGIPVQKYVLELMRVNDAQKSYCEAEGIQYEEFFRSRQRAQSKKINGLLGELKRESRRLNSLIRNVKALDPLC